MKPIYPFKIVGVGKYLPNNRISSEELESRLSIPRGWSERYSGVKARHHATFESNAYMGVRALEGALQNAGLAVQDLGLLLSASATYDYPLPNQSSLIKWELQVEDEIDFPCVDIDASCLSFVTALDYAAKSLHPLHCRYIAIVSTEISSKGLNPENWETATLFGDAAAAIILSVDPSGPSGAIKYAMRTYAQGAMNTIIRGGGNQYFFRDHPYDPALHSFSMDGLQLLRLAKLKIPKFMDFFFRDLPWGLEEIDRILPHQATKAGLMVFRSLPAITTEGLNTFGCYIDGELFGPLDSPGFAWNPIDADYWLNGSGGFQLDCAQYDKQSDELLTMTLSSSFEAEGVYSIPLYDDLFIDYKNSLSYYLDTLSPR